MQQIYLVDLNQFKALLRKVIPTGFNKRGFSRASRTGKQDIISGVPRNKLRRIPQDSVFLTIHILQRIQYHPVRIPDRLQVAHPIRRLEATKCPGTQVGLWRRGWEHSFHTVNQTFKEADKLIKLSHSNS